MTTTQTITPLPHRAEFIRTALIEHMDSLGHHVYDVEDRDGFPCLTIEAADGSSYEDIAITTDGRLMSMVDGWRQVTLRGFDWEPEATDTGMAHGPFTRGYLCSRCDDPMPFGSMHPVCRTLPTVPGTHRAV